MTPDQVKAKFRREGRTFADFARQHGFPISDVYRVLGGQYKGYYGRAHKISVALGIKAPPAEDNEQRAA